MDTLAWGWLLACGGQKTADERRSCTNCSSIPPSCPRNTTPLPSKISRVVCKKTPLTPDCSSSLPIISAQSLQSKLSRND